MGCLTCFSGCFGRKARNRGKKKNEEKRIKAEKKKEEKRQKALEKAEKQKQEKRQKAIEKAEKVKAKKTAKQKGPGPAAVQHLKLERTQDPDVLTYKIVKSRGKTYHVKANTKTGCCQTEDYPGQIKKILWFDPLIRCYGSEPQNPNADQQQTKQSESAYSQNLEECRSGEVPFAILEEQEQLDIPEKLREHVSGKAFVGDDDTKAEVEPNSPEGKICDEKPSIADPVMDMVDSAIYEACWELAGESALESDMSFSFNAPESVKDILVSSDEAKAVDSLLEEEVSLPEVLQEIASGGPHVSHSGDPVMDLVDDAISKACEELAAESALDSDLALSLNVPEIVKDLSSGDGQEISALLEEELSLPEDDLSSLLTGLAPVELQKHLQTVTLSKAQEWIAGDNGCLPQSAIEAPDPVKVIDQDKESLPPSMPSAFEAQDPVKAIDQDKESLPPSMPSAFEAPDPVKVIDQDKESLPPSMPSAFEAPDPVEVIGQDKESLPPSMQNALKAPVLKRSNVVDNGSINPEMLQVALIGHDAGATAPTAAAAAVCSPEDKWHTCIVQRLQFAYKDHTLLLSMDHVSPFLATPIDVEYITKRYQVKHNVNPFILEKEMLLDPNRELFDESHAKLMGVCLISALDFLKVRGIVHGRIQPGSMEISSNGYPVLMKLEKAIKATGKPVTYKNARLRIEFTAPEVLRTSSTSHATFASDAFSYGCLLCWMLQGSTPYRGADIKITKKQVLDRERLAVLDLNKMTTKAAELINECVQKNTEQRKVLSLSAIYQERWFESAQYVESVLNQTRTSPYLATIAQVQKKAREEEERQRRLQLRQQQEMIQQTESCSQQPHEEKQNGEGKHEQKQDPEGQWTMHREDQTNGEAEKKEPP